jgi:phosphate-selective porin OprO/OprP
MLLKRLNQLEQEVGELRAKLSAVEAAQQDQQIQSEPAAQVNDGNSITWKGAPEFKSDEGWRFKPRGRLQFDAASLSSLPPAVDVPGEGFSNEARRIRLGAQGNMPGGFGFKFEVDFLNDIVITDAYFDYRAGPVKLVIGHHNSYQGLEELSSSNDTSFIERSAWTDAFGFERKIGISGIYKVGDFLMQGGVFTDNLDDLSDDNDSIGFDARVVAAPKLGDAQLHFGGSYHWRDLADSINTIRYRQRPLEHSIDTRFVNTGNISHAVEELTYGLETAVIAGRLHIAAETHWATITREGFADPTFFGGSVEAGFFLTDDTRVYKDGIFRNINVRRPVSDGGIGAWQVNLRFDQLDLVDAGVIGGVQDAYMASLIWTPVDHVRFLLNYSHMEYSDAASIVDGAPREYGIDVFGARAQLDF